MLQNLSALCQSLQHGSSRYCPLWNSQRFSSCVTYSRELKCLCNLACSKLLFRLSTFITYTCVTGKVHLLVVYVESLFDSPKCLHCPCNKCSSEIRKKKKGSVRKSAVGCTRVRWQLTPDSWLQTDKCSTYAHFSRLAFIEATTTSSKCLRCASTFNSLGYYCSITAQLQKLLDT